MAANWNDPVNTTVYSSVLANLKDRDLSIAKMDFTGDTNLVAGFLRINTTTKALEKYNGSTWDVLYYFEPTGNIKQTFGATAPAGWLLLQGGTIGNASSGGTARANADCSDLFVHLWNNLANAQAAVSGGRGASAAADFAANKTITLPDMRQRFPLGKAASGTGVTLGETGGSIDHTHTLPAHYHGMGTGSTLSVDINHDHPAVTTSADGAHQHNVTGVSGEAIGWYTSGTGNRIAPALNAANSFGGGTAIANTSSTHTHTLDLPALGATPKTPTGLVGLVTGGVNGNAAMTSGSNNPKYLAMNFIIKL